MEADLHYAICEAYQRAISQTQCAARGFLAGKTGARATSRRAAGSGSPV